MTLPAISGKKMAKNVAFGGFGSNFNGMVVCLPSQLVGFLLSMWNVIHMHMISTGSQIIVGPFVVRKLDKSILKLENHRKIMKKNPALCDRYHQKNKGRITRGSPTPPYGPQTFLFSQNLDLIHHERFTRSVPAK